MAIAKLRCNLCERELQPHCPSPANHTCTWMRCTNHACSAELYDVARGILRHRDGRQEGWDDQPTTDQPPTVTVTEACRHCGRLPDADGDHSCPCPYPDHECPDHGRPPAPNP